MSKLATNTILIRGESYLVSELDGKTMVAVRKLLNGDQKERAETFVVWKCLVDPKQASEAEVMELPQLVIDKVASEAFRLSKVDGTDEEKND